ncbi:hypothetical protein [Streptomyces sp. NPDC023588]|uniref:hypothetical protein n=1 Tax=Streptomyces sp. NPDC023588 TaxID=3154907 RepID=UPI0033E3528C
MDEVQPNVSDASVDTATEAANQLIQRYIDDWARWAMVTPSTLPTSARFWKSS